MSDTILTYALVAALVAGAGAALLALPWTDAELDETDRGFRALGRRLADWWTGR